MNLLSLLASFTLSLLCQRTTAERTVMATRLIITSAALSSRCWRKIIERHFWLSLVYCPSTPINTPQYQHWPSPYENRAHQILSPPYVHHQFLFSIMLRCRWFCWHQVTSCAPHPCTQSPHPHGYIRQLQSHQKTSEEAGLCTVAELCAVQGEDEGRENCPLWCPSAIDHIVWPTVLHVQHVLCQSGKQQSWGHVGHPSASKKPNQYFIYSVQLIEPSWSQ